MDAGTSTLMLLIYAAAGLAGALYTWHVVLAMFRRRPTDVDYERRARELLRRHRSNDDRR